MDPSKDYYATLGVLPSVEPIAIRAVYLALLNKYHPDVHHGAKDEAIKKTKAFNEAYNILGDEKSRKEYDWLRAKFSSETQRYNSHQCKASAASRRGSLTAKKSDSGWKIYQLRAFAAGIIGIVVLVLIIIPLAGSD
jgi:curved DNA-binding protein CbpA